MADRNTHTLTHTSSVSASPSPSSSTAFPVPSEIISFTMEQNLKHTLCCVMLFTITHTHTHTRPGVLSPTTLFFCREVDLKVVRVVVDVQEAAALVKLADAAEIRFLSERNIKHDLFFCFSIWKLLSHLIPLMDDAEKFHSWIPFCQGTVSIQTQCWKRREDQSTV